MVRSRYAAMLPYIGAAGLVVAAVSFRAALDPMLRNRQPFSAFLVAVLLASRFCGFWPSVLTVFVSAAASRWFFVPPRYSLSLPSSIETGSLGFFIVFGLFCALVMRSERRAYHKLQSEIDERKRTDEQLRLRESQLAGILDNSPAVIYLKDAEGKYLLTNRTYRELFRHVGRDIVGQTDHEFFPEPFASRFVESDERVWREGVPIYFEETAPHSDGPHTYRSVKFPVRDLAGTMVALGGISTDISDLKSAQSSLEQEQALLRNLIDVQEQERRHLCHEIHDGLIQYSVAARMTLEAYQDKHPHDDASELLTDVVKNLHRGIEDGRRAIRGIRPAVLDDCGIDAAIDDLIEQFAGSGIMVTSKYDPAMGPLPNNVQTTLYRVIQEALNNSRKHSGTDVIRIEAAKKERTLEFKIEDFGCGFDLQGMRPKGLGLLGMTERMRLIGGDCSIHSEPNVGTRVIVSLPIELESS